MTAKFLFVMLYAALTLGANPVLAKPLNLSQIAALRTGDMQRLEIYSDPFEMPATGFLDENSNPVSLDAYKGKIVLLNIWATWCPPCLAELPSIDALQAELGGDDFAVVPVAMGRNPVVAIKKFYAKAGIKHLPILRDPKQKFARANGILGLPTTIILNEKGQEIARMIGDADWHSKEALTLIKALLP
ncbi:MAG: TlpA disulfide reductase family protein [Rhodobacterales bacterium]